jgi:hypothetical protein
MLNCKAFSVPVAPSNSLSPRRQNVDHCVKLFFDFCGKHGTLWINWK